MKYLFYFLSYMLSGVLNFSYPLNEGGLKIVNNFDPTVLENAAWQ